VKTALIIPVFNEERRLPASFPRLHSFLSGRLDLDWEIIIANNGSTDQTQQVAEGLACAHPRTTVQWIPEKGRGGALKRAWLGCDADILSYMDVDLATDLEFFPLLVHSLACGEADIAVGSRFLPASRTSRSLGRRVLSRGYMALVRALCAARFSDAQCGFKALSREAARALLPGIRDNGWFFDTELLVRAQWAGLRVRELAVNWAADGDSRVRIISTAWRDLRGLWRLRRELRRHPPSGPLPAFPSRPGDGAPELGRGYPGSDGPAPRHVV
jgi:glycosyltransferase involved in cell wall biosynthesis